MLIHEDRLFLAKPCVRTLTTTDSHVDSLADHRGIWESGLKAKIVPNFRLDTVVDPEFPKFSESIAKLREQTGKDMASWIGY